MESEFTLTAMPRRRAPAPPKAFFGRSSSCSRRQRSACLPRSAMPGGAQARPERTSGMDPWASRPRFVEVPGHSGMKGRRQTEPRGTLRSICQAAPPGGRPLTALTGANPCRRLYEAPGRGSRLEQWRRRRDGARLPTCSPTGVVGSQGEEGNLPDRPGARMRCRRLLLRKSAATEASMLSSLTRR